MWKIEWPTTKPICSCSELFASERDFRGHLHDVHGLTNGTWLRPQQPAPKRKANPRAEGAFIDEAGQQKRKKIRFQRWQPQHPRQFMAERCEKPATTRTAFVTQLSPITLDYLDLPTCSRDIETASLSSGFVRDGTNTMSPMSSLSSLRSTPGIDPRILGLGYPKPDVQGSLRDGTSNSPDITDFAEYCNEMIDEEVADSQMAYHSDTIHIDNEQSERENTRVTGDMTAEPFNI